jgi:hypothetical protein
VSLDAGLGYQVLVGVMGVCKSVRHCMPSINQNVGVWQLGYIGYVGSG